MAIADHIKKDSPTNNFAVLNPLITGVTNDLRDGNLYVVGQTSCLATSTFAMTTGKWYWEIFSVYSGNVNSYYGVIRESLASNPSSVPWEGSFSFMQSGGMYLNDTSYTSPDGTGLNWSSNDVLGFLYDADTGSLSAYKNGVFQTTKTVSALSNIPVVTCFSPSIGSGASSSGHYNFGANSSFGGNKTSGSAYATDGNGIGDFYYDPPTVSGTKALALCTANIQSSLAIDPAVDDVPEDYFKCVTYPGTGSANNINVGFTPDLVWIKCKDHTFDHMIFDSIRGVNKNIYSNGTSQEVTTNNSLTEFITTGNKGFKVVSDNGVNNSSYNYISWNWKAGGAPQATNTATSGTMDNNSVSIDGVLQSNYTPSGTIYPKSISIGTEQQFSITKYFGNETVGATIGHGLNGIPDLTIIKSLGQAGTWQVYNSLTGAGRILGLNTSSARTTANAAYFNQVLPNATVVTLGYDGNGNEQNDNTDYIMYCWRSVEGFSAFGSYTGNGDDDDDHLPDPPFIYTGFSPAFVWIKAITHVRNWYLFDNVRSTHNENNNPLISNGSTAESNVTVAGYKEIDFLSNGFKIRNDRDQINKSGESYLYCAWAEQPTKFANAK